MESKTTNEAIQIISKDMEYNEHLKDFVKRTINIENTTDYNLVAILGSQSTGKSTLLNEMFCTKFQTMSPEKRRQTTQGVWLEKAKDKNIIVMDVEGSDGVERGEDQEFERKSALFSIAVSEVIIINIWEHQIGLYNGANMSLLKTVFQVNLDLFVKNKKTIEKTIMYIVIRDFVGTTKIEMLQKTLKKELDMIWQGLHKEEQINEVQIDDVFEFRYKGIAHKILQEEKFKEDVNRLRMEFVDIENEQHLFSNNFNKKNKTPIDGLADYMEKVWETIMLNKDLDIPTQHQLVAQFRCDEIIGEILTQLNSSVANIQLGPDKSFEVLATQLQELVSVNIQEFDTKCHKYDTKIYLLKKQEFIKKVAKRCIDVYGLLLDTGKKRTLKEVKEQHKSGEFCCYEEYKQFTEYLTKSFEKYKSNCHLFQIQEYEERNSFDSKINELEEEINEIKTSAKAKTIQTINSKLKDKIKEKNKEQVDSIQLTDEKMWSCLDSYFESLQAIIKSEFDDEISRFDYENSSLLTKNIRADVFDDFFAALKYEFSKSDTLFIKLKHFFEQRFRYDNENIPKVWKPTDDIEAVYKSARDNCLELIPILGKVQYEGFEAMAQKFNKKEAHIVVLSDQSLQSIKNRLSIELETQFKECKRSVISTNAKIPPWVIALLLVLGWNELMALISSPLYFVSLLVLLGTSYFLYRTNMLKPFILVVNSVFNEIYYQAVTAIANNHNSRTHLVPEADNK